MWLKKIRELPEELFSSGTFHFEAISKRANHLQFEVRLTDLSTILDVRSDSSYLRGVDSIVFLDAQQPTLLGFASLQQMGQLELQVPITTPLLLTSTNFSFWSDSSQAVFVFEFATQELLFVASAARPPVVSKQFFAVGGIACINNKPLALGAFVAADPTLRNARDLDGLGESFSRCASAVASRAERSSFRGRHRGNMYLEMPIRAPLSEFSPTRLTFHSDLSGSYLFVLASRRAGPIVGVVVDLDAYLAAGGFGFFEMSTPIAISELDGDADKAVRLQVIPELGGFSLIRLGGAEKSLYALNVENLLFRGMGGVIPIKSQPIGEWYSHHYLSVNESALLTRSGDAETYQLIGQSSSPVSPRPVRSYSVGISDGQLFLQRPTVLGHESFWLRNLPKAEMLNYLLHGLPAERALDLRKQLLVAGPFPDMCTEHSFQIEPAYRKQYLTGTLKGSLEKSSKFSDSLIVSGSSRSIRDLLTPVSPLSTKLRI